MSNTTTSAASSPGRLLRMTLQVHGSQENKIEENETFVRDYLTKVAGIHARNGIEMYQQVFTPPVCRGILEEMKRRKNRGWVINDHDISVELYFRSFAELERVNQDPEFQALQASEGPYVNRVRTVVTLGWVEKYVDGRKVVNIENGKSTYPPWSELRDFSTAFPIQLSQ